MRAACCCAGSLPVWSGGRTEQGEINIAAELQTGTFCKVSWLEDNERGKLDYPGRWTCSRDVIIDRKNECHIFSTLKNTHVKKTKRATLWNLNPCILWIRHWMGKLTNVFKQTEPRFKALRVPSRTFSVERRLLLIFERFPPRSLPQRPDMGRLNFKHK